MNPSPCTGVLIVHKNKVLITRRVNNPGKGKFEIPGGFMDMSDMSLEAAACREIEEELGLKAVDLSPLAYFASAVQKYDWYNSEIHTACSYFTCSLQISPTQIHIDDTEIAQLRWVGKNDLAALNFAFETDVEMLMKHFGG